VAIADASLSADNGGDNSAGVDPITTFFFRSLAKV